MNISELFLAASKQYPHKMAIIDASKSITYSQLEKEVKTTAAYFKSKGIIKGDRVLVFVPMGVNLYRIVLALFYIGATAVFLDEWVSKKRLALCCELANCKGFVGVFKARVFALFSKELRKIPIKLKLNKQDTKAATITQVEASATALITFTTGSTGTPKAADRTHGFLKEQFDALLDEINPQTDDVDMPVLPIVLFVNLGVGCTSVIADFKITKPEAIKVSNIASQLIKNKANRIIASPFFVKKLAEYAIENKVSFTNIKNIFTGGAPVFPNEAALYLQAFPSTKSHIVYGSTEAEPISSISAKELLGVNHKLPNGLPVGKLYHKIELKIISITADKIPTCTKEEFNNLNLKQGEIGEIIVSGKHVLKQYFKNEEAFKQNKIVVDEVIWHRTGDSGMMIDDELFLTGRCQQLIVNGDTYLSPFIIENQLQNIEGVEIGTLMQIDGKNIVVLQTTLSENELKNQLSNIPFDEIKLMDIPRDQRHNSKIDYGKLKELLSHFN